MDSTAADKALQTTSSPMGIPWTKMMMWWFIVSDGLIFASVLAAYLFSRLAAGAGGWPDQSEMFDMRLITLMTFILISSSATMATAVAASGVKDGKMTVRMLWLTILGGSIFLGMQVIEWRHLIHEGARLHENPWGIPQFGAYFFVITGLHGFHVFTGVIVLLVVAIRASMGRYTMEGVELAGLYWHFVDLVWVFVFGCFYLV